MASRDWGAGAHKRGRKSNHAAWKWWILILGLILALGVLLLRLYRNIVPSIVSAAKVLAESTATDIVESGKSFVIFPEGTRYKGEEGGAGEFKAGAFRIAVKTGAPVVPVAITGARALVENNGNLCHPGSVHIKVLPPIRTAGMSKAEQKQLPDAVRQAILAQL